MRGATPSYRPCIGNGYADSLCFFIKFCSRERPGVHLIFYFVATERKGKKNEEYTLLARKPFPNTIVIKILKTIAYLVQCSNTGDCKKIICKLNCPFYGKMWRNRFEVQLTSVLHTSTLNRYFVSPRPVYRYSIRLCCYLLFEVRPPHFK